MSQTARPLSPHLGIYRKEIQSITSIVHRASGLALVVGTLVVLYGLFALAGGADAYTQFRTCVGAWWMQVLLIGWTWSLSLHLLNGIRHLAQDAGFGFAINQFVRNSWLAVIGSLLLTALIWFSVLTLGGGV